MQFLFDVNRYNVKWDLLFLFPLERDYLQEELKNEQNRIKGKLLSECDFKKAISNFPA